MEIIYLLIGLMAGAIIGFLFFKLRNKTRDNDWFKEKANFEKSQVQYEERLKFFSRENEQIRTELQQVEEQNKAHLQRLAKAEVEFANLREKLSTQKQEMEDLQKKFTNELENVANKIREKKNEKFTTANQKKIGEVLNPLKEKIQLFEKKVEDTYKQGLKDQTDLRAELKKLYDLNSKISEEANNLTKALKGDVKKQGNWGEVVLERILERSGLNEGSEGYEKQFSTYSDEGKRIQPDIVINLPDDKHIIVDSKVSLVAYEKAVNAGNEEERAQFLKEHLLSLKHHIKGLSEKHYQNAGGINSPDFVLLFIPIEASFSVAVQEDQDLFSYAWDQKVVLVSPSTLLATLRTIASVWKQENQTRNAIEIARQGGALYDKFVGFVADMEKIGSQLKSTGKVYDDAMGKLRDGRGNLLRSAEKLHELGVKTKKELPKQLLEDE